MGFTSGAKTLPDLVDDIADGLIASSAYWSDADTTWNTTDRTSNNAKRVVKYTGDAADIYFSFLTINISTASVYWNGSYHRYAKGLLIVVSADWDYVNHTYPSTNQHTYIPFERRDGNNEQPTADMATLQLTYYLWIDATGFVIMAKPEPTGDENQTSFICVLEHMDVKEYSDGLSNFFIYTMENYTGNENYSSTDIYKPHRIVRPFAYEEQAYSDSTAELVGLDFYSGSWYAFKSNGNGKVYYMKPLIYNDQAETMPIYQSKLFFQFSTGVGLVDGDVIAVDGQTTKYLCKSLDSPDSTALINYAMKYVA